MENSCEPESQIQVEKIASTSVQVNGSKEEKERTDRTPCEALPGWTRVVVERKTGSSAGKSDVYYYSPAGKKVRSKPEIENLLLKTGGDNVIDLSKFDYRSGTFVERMTTRKRKKPAVNDDAFGKNLSDYSMAGVPCRQSKKIVNGSVTYVSNDVEYNSNGLDLHQVPKVNGVGLVSPRQIYWERRLQNMNGKNGLVDYDIFSNKNGEFRSLLHSIVKTLQMERDMADKRKPVIEGTHKQQMRKKHIRITKADIRKQEKEVIKARRELAKAITEYEIVKYS